MNGGRMFSPCQTMKRKLLRNICQNLTNLGIQNMCHQQWLCSNICLIEKYYQYIKHQICSLFILYDHKCHIPEYGKLFCQDFLIVFTPVPISLIIGPGALCTPSVVAFTSLASNCQLSIVQQSLCSGF